MSSMSVVRTLSGKFKCSFPPIKFRSFKSGADMSNAICSSSFKSAKSRYSQSIKSGVVERNITRMNSSYFDKSRAGILS